MMNLCLIDCYLNRGVMCLIWEGAEPPASLVTYIYQLTPETNILPRPPVALRGVHTKLGNYRCVGEGTPVL